MKIRMKTDDAVPGWVAMLYQMGIKESYRPGRFGRTHHLIKMGGEAIQVVQSSSAGMTTIILDPTPKQREIAAALVATGVATVT